MRKEKKNGHVAKHRNEIFFLSLDGLFWQAVPTIKAEKSYKDSRANIQHQTNTHY